MNLLELQMPLLYAMNQTAINTKRHIGSNNKNLIDGIAVKSFRDYINTEFNVGITVVIGEGEKDKAPMLYNGEKLGHGEALYDIAIDPVEGTTLAAEGKENAISVLGISRAGSMKFLEEFYSKRLVVASDLANKVSVSADINSNIKAIAKYRRKNFGAIKIALLNRNRHKQDIEQITGMGAKVVLVEHGDLAYGILALLRREVDMLYGIGGTPESIILASAVIAMDGYMEMMPVLNYRELVLDKENPQIYYGNVVKARDVIADTDPCFIATALTSSCLGLNGVKYHKSYVDVEHMIMYRGVTTKISVTSET